MVSFISDRAFAAILLGAAAFSFQGCSPDDPADTAPPDYTIPNFAKSQGKWRFGVTDTLAVRFSEKIDTAALALTFTPSQGIDYRFDGADRLLVFGRNRDAGMAHFTINAPFTLSMAGLKDLHGNGRPLVTEAFAPYYWSDRDFTDSAFQGFDSLFADDSTWADSSRMFADTLLAEGRLDFNGNGLGEDRQDFKLMKLTPPDTFRIVVTCPKSVNLRMQIAGPFAPGKQDSVLRNYSFPGGERTFYADTNKTKGSMSYSLTADFTRHYKVLGSSAAPGLYAIRLSLPEDQEGFYRIEATAGRDKRP